MDIKDLIVIIAGFLWLPLSVIVGLLANKRGRFGYNWFLLSVVVTPVVTGPLLLALPRQSASATVSTKNTEPQSPINEGQLEITASPKLRLIFIMVAAAMFVLWGLSLIPPIESWGNPNEDGLRLVYFGTANAAPYDLRLLGGKPKDALFTDSIIAVHADTGHLAWYYQTTPADHWDFDACQKLVLADLKIGNAMRPVIMQANKNGFFYVLDRRTGASRYRHQPQQLRFPAFLSA